MVTCAPYGGGITCASLASSSAANGSEAALVAFRRPLFRDEFDMLLWDEQRFLSYLLESLYSTSTRFNFYRTHKIKNNTVQVNYYFCL